MKSFKLKSCAKFIYSFWLEKINIIWGFYPIIFQILDSKIHFYKGWFLRFSKFFSK